MRRLLPVIAILVLSGCATVTRGSKEAFAIETDPVGAKADVTDARGMVSCHTPCSVKVKRRGPLHIVITKEGYEVLRTTISSSIDGGGAAGMAGNVLVGGLIGAAVDAGSGAMHSHKPNPLVAKLVPLLQPEAQAPTEGTAVGPEVTESSASAEQPPGEGGS